MKSRGSPVLGDVAFSSVAEADRVYLHALVVRFQFDGEWIELVCEPMAGVAFTSVAVAQRRQVVTPPSTLAWPAVE